MSIATEILRLSTAKANIKSAIIAKGVSVPNEAKLDTYNTYVSQISGGGGGGGQQWSPHSDWIDISTINDNEINLLVSDGGVGIAFSVTTASGTYSIDWGDGVIETARASGTTYSHQYTIGSGQSVNSGQYTCFKIRIYGASSNITRFQMQKVPGYNNSQYCGLLWAVFGTQNITTYANTFYQSGIECRELQACTIPSLNNCSSTSSMFQNCFALSSITLPTSWGSVTSCSQMFYSCYALSSITLPTSWGNVTNCSYMFYYCYALSSITLPTSWGNVTNCSYMFYYCYALRILNNLDYLGSATTQSDFTDILRNCEALTGTLTIASLLTNVGIYGASGKLLKCTAIRLTNAGSTFTGSSPQVNVSYTRLDATALNQLFTDLPTLTGKTINITGSAGAATCNRTIATAKNWTVVG